MLDGANRGVNLTLMIGPLVPIPAPRAVLEALNEVTVTTSDTGRSGFQLAFTLGTRSPLHTLFLLSGGSPMPVLRVIVVVTLNGTPNVLVDGVVTNHEIVSGSGGHATLTVTGEDLSVLMDQQDLSGFPFPAVPAEGRVALLCAKYAVLGIVPLVLPSVLVNVPIPTNRIEGQRGTDLSYIRALAERVGYVFYIEPGPEPGMSIAYWGPQIKVGIPQPALNVDMDAHTNVQSLSFTFDNTQNAIPTLFYYNELTKVVIPIPIPPITPLSPPLGLIPPIPTRLEPVADNLAKYPLAQGIMCGLAQAAKWAEAVTGKGELSVLRYGRILKARQLVGVRGAGPAFDGLHYVKSVTHKIKPGDYRQSFELSRNGLISTLPRVPA
jgi:hypothetical protein